jgi:hypothetical protein
LVAVGFLDEQRVIVGSHSGIGVFDASTGARVERLPADDCSWYQGDPPFIRRPGPAGVRLIPAEGLWGGELDRSTADGWSCELRPDGAQLVADGQTPILVVDPEDRRAYGFSSRGRTFVYATSASLNLVHR